MSFDTATPRIASYVILRRGDKVAFILRTKTAWMNDHYSLPSGKIEQGEPYSHGAIREVEEEAGVIISPEDLRFVHVVHRYEGSDWVDVYFEASKWTGEAHNAEPHMHGELAWFGMQDLPENVIPSVRHALKKISRGEVFSEYGWDQ